MKTSLTYLCLLAFQLSSQAEVIVKSSFDYSLESGAKAVWKGQEPEFVHGVEGGAVHLKGEQYLSLPGDLKFNQEEGSIHLWVKTDWAGNDGHMHRLLALGTKSGIRILKDEKNRLAFVWSPGGEAKDLVVPDSIAAKWPPNEWQHLAFTWKHGFYTLYLGGKASIKGEATAPVAPLTETTPLYLGGNKEAPGDFTADELVFCNHALSRQEVLEVFVHGMEQIEKVDNPQLIMHALINDHPAALILDTGTSYNCLFRPFAMQAGIKARPSSLGKGLFQEEANAIIKMADAAPGFNQLFAVLNYIGHCRQQGILGWHQFFEANLLCILWDQRTMVPLERSNIDELSADWKAHAYPQRTGNLRLPRCTIRIDDIELNLPLVIDTGEGSGLTLTSKTWADVQPKISTAKQYLNSAWTVDNGMKTFVSVVPQSVSMLGAEMHGISVSENQHHQNNGKNDEHASIGLAALSYFEVVIDGEKGNLWLKQRATPAIREKLNTSGLVFSTATREDGILVEVLDGSPAWNLGLRSRDSILTVDGKKLDVKDLDEMILLKDQISAGKPVRLKVVRGSKLIEMGETASQVR